jgi:hypothetical protein
MIWLPLFLTLRPNYKYYKKTYLDIKNKQYLLSYNGNSFIILKPKDKVMCSTGFNQWLDDDEIIYFKDNQSIKLANNVYIHRDIISIDPYTYYWYRKIKKEILLNTRSIAQIREDKLKQLNIKR